MNKIITLLTIMLLFTGCSVITEQTTRSEEAVESYFDNEVSLEDEVIPLSPFEEETLVSPGESFYLKPFEYNILGVKRDNQSALLILDIEVRNTDSKTLDFDASGMLLLSDDPEGNEGTYSPEDNTKDMHRLKGIIQAGNRISGSVAFPMPEMTDNTVFLSVNGGRKHFLHAYEISKGDFDKTYPPIFTNGEVISGYGKGVPITSDLLEIILIDIRYEGSTEDQVARAVCSFSITNISDESAIFLTGYNIAGAHDLAGNGLYIDSGDVTIPKIIEGGATVYGDVTVDLITDSKAFYLTVMPDENAFDDKRIIIVE